MDAGQVPQAPTSVHGDDAGCPRRRRAGRCRRRRPAAPAGWLRSSPRPCAHVRMVVTSVACRVPPDGGRHHRTMVTHENARAAPRHSRARRPGSSPPAATTTTRLHGHHRRRRGTPRRLPATTIGTPSPPRHRPRPPPATSSPPSGDVAEITVTRRASTSGPDRVEPVPPRPAGRDHPAVRPGRGVPPPRLRPRRRRPRPASRRRSSFTADKPGPFELESHVTDDVLLVLQVRLTVRVRPAVRRQAPDRRSRSLPTRSS